MLNDRIKDLLFCVISLIVALIVLTVGFRYQNASAYFPQLLALFIGVCAMTFGYQRWRDTPSSEQTEGQPELLGFVKVVLSILAYTGLLLFVGFPVATVLFLVGLMWVLGARRWPVIFPTAIGLTALLYFLFFWFLGVYPPDSLLTY